MRPRTPQPEHPTDHPVSWEPSLLFLKFGIRFTLGGALAYLLALTVFAPGQTWRSVAALVVVALSLAGEILIARGAIRAAVRVMATGIWTTVAVSSVFFGGLDSTTMIVIPILILLLGWLESGRAALMLAILSSVTTLGFAVAQSWGYMPTAPGTPPALRWIVQAVVFIVTAVLIDREVGAYRARLEEVRALGRRLEQRTAEVQAREADLHRAQSVAHVGSWVYDIDADEIHMSDETCRIFGLPLGTSGNYDTYVSRAHPDDRVALTATWDQALRGTILFDHEHRILVGDEIRWVRQLAELEFGADGVAHRGVGTTQDVTARRRADDALRESESRLSAIINASPVSIVMSRLSDGTILHINDVALARFGALREEVVGRTMAQLGAFGDATQQRELWHQLRDHGAVDQFPIDMRMRNGEELKVELSSRIILIDGEPCVLANIRDVTELLRLQEAQLRAQQLQSLGTLAGGIAHDFNNILSAVRGNVDLVLEDVDKTHAVADYLREIQRASDRASELVRRIMGFGRPRETQAQRVSLADVTTEVLGLLRATVPASIALVPEFDPDARRVLADAGQVHEAIVNLTMNAIHAIGSRDGAIRYRLETVDLDAARARGIPGLTAGAYTCLSIIDNGCGMDAGTLSRIFDAFFTTKPVGEGTGLGLSMVYGTMKSHGGAVTAESTPGEGACLTLYFPAAPIRGSERAVVRQTPPSLASHKGPARRVLFVDDEEPLVFIASLALTRMGHTVTAFSDATLALEAFRARPDEFDIVLTDLAMPKLPGFELARQVLAVRPDVPVLLLSGNIGHDDEANARAIGIRQMVLKPVAMSALVRIMERQFNAAAPVPASPAAPVAPGDGAGGDEAGTAAR